MELAVKGELDTIRAASMATQRYIGRVQCGKWEHEGSARQTFGEKKVNQGTTTGTGQ